MSEKPGGSPAQKSVTTIDPWVPRIAALVIPVLAGAAILVGGLHFAKELLVWGAVILLFLAISALLAYMLTTGQFPPRMPRDAVELPADEVKETGQSLDLIQQSVSELAERVERIEGHLGIEDEQS